MARPSKIDRLPKEVRQLIADLRDQGRTIGEIHGKLRELNVEVSRTGVGNQVQKIERFGAILRTQRETASVLMSKLDDAEPDKVARLNGEILHHVLTKLAMSEDGEGIANLSPKEAALLGRLHRDLAASKKTDVDRITAAEKQAEVRARVAAAATATASMKRQGLSADTIKQIERDILGVTT